VIGIRRERIQGLEKMPLGPLRSSAMQASPLVFVIGVFLALSVLAAYRGILGADFVFDDGPYIRDNPHVLGGLTRENVLWAFTSSLTSNWQPLTWLSLQLDVQLFGPGPSAHHAVNLMMHAMNAILLLFVLLRLTSAAWRSAAVAALFALHPLHVESVAWVSERKDLFSTTFFLAALLVYVRHLTRSLWWTATMVFLLFALGLMAKPMIVTMPFVLLVLDWWPLRRPLGWGLLREKIPLFGLAAASCAMTLWAQGAGGALGSLTSHPLKLRLANALAAYLGYLNKAFWPSGLAVYYPYSRGAPLSLRAALALTVILAISAVAVRVRSRHPWLLAGWLWYLGMLVPVIGLVQVGGQASADRYTYLPLVGLFAAVVWGAPGLMRRLALSRAIAAAVAFTVLGACLAATRVQVAFWKNERTLFEHALEVTEGNWLAHNVLGALDMSERKAAAALAHFQESLRIAPGNNPQAHSNLGDLELQRGRMRAAVKHYEIVLSLDGADPDDHLNLGVALAALGRSEEAMRQYLEALRLNPGMADAHYNLGNVLSRERRYPEAIFHYREAIRIDPGNDKARNNLGVALRALGRGEIPAAPDD
jgi:protein O-mannosyl-transferase